jgi:hypothetical protein
MGTTPQSSGAMRHVVLQGFGKWLGSPSVSSSVLTDFFSVAKI